MSSASTLERTSCVALLTLLAGCSGLLHSSAAPEQTYFLRAPAAPQAAPAPALNTSLRVARPQADPGLDSPHITLLQPDHRMSFYAGSRWAGPVPDLIESLAVQTLRAAGQWASVQDSSSPFPSDYLLQITVRRFDADYGGGGTAPQVHVVLDCILGRREGRDVVATFLATGEAPASANRQAAVVDAFEQALGGALSALQAQTVQSARADSAHSGRDAPQKLESPAPSSSRPSQ